MPALVYSEQFKAETVRRIQTEFSGNAKEASRSLGIRHKTLCTWLKESAHAPAAPLASPVQILERDREVARLREQLKARESQYKVALAQLDEMERARDAALAITAPASEITISRPKKSVLREATPFIIASDWHFGAIIKKTTTNGLNEFNPDIAVESAEKFFQNALKLVEKERHGARIREIVFGILGDMIENYLHPELIEEATLSPIEQTQLVQKSLRAGIDYWLKHGDFEKIRVVTSPGNHGRTTDKMRASTSYKNSYEQMMYWALRDHYTERGEKRIDWQTEDNYATYLTCYDQTVRFHHGEAIKYAGGVGGILVPLRRWTMKANMQRYAHMTFCGHFHGRVIDDDVGAVVNPSLCGASAYSMKFGFKPTPPSQTFFLLDERGVWTSHNPIFVR